jgi:uncharacterized protein
MSRADDWRVAVSLRLTPVGKGVFARRPFRKGQAVGLMRGELIADDDYDPSYCVDMGKLGVLEPKTPFRYLNHSCEPNCELVEWEAEPGEEPEVWVHALRSVRPNDQLTIDYAWPADAAIRCKCGSASCRGWVVDASELKILERRARAKKDKARKARQS